MVFVELWKVAQCLGETFRSVLHEMFHRRRFVLELFFEQGKHHNGGRAGVFHPPDVAEIFGQWRSRRNDWMLQFHTHITSAQIHFSILLQFSSVVAHASLFRRGWACGRCSGLGEVIMRIPAGSHLFIDAPFQIDRFLR